MAFLFSDDKTRIDLADAIQPYLTALQTSFQASINAIYQKLVTLDSTPADKTLNSILSAIQALTEKTWEQSLSIDKVSYVENGETKYLNTREVPFNCRDLVSIVIAFAYVGGSLSGSQTFSLGSIKWYNANGAQVGTSNINVTITGTTYSGNYSQKFTPASGATRATLEFKYSAVAMGVANITNVPTATYKYQTKVLR